MKKRRKWLIPVLVAVSLLLSAVVITSLDLTTEKPYYTIFNYKDMGTSLLHDTLNGMGYNVSPEYQLIGPDSDIHTIRIVIEPDYSYYYIADTDSDIYQFVNNGGRLISLTNQAPYISKVFERDKGAALIAQNGEFKLYSYGLGEIFIGPANITNAELLINKESGYYVADVIQRWGDKNIYINEAYHGYMTEPEFWDVVPDYIKNTVYQLVIAGLFIILYLGKRFGRPVPYYEEIEREENEYLIALANVYNKAGNGYIIYETGLERFLKKAAAKFGIVHEGISQTRLSAILSEEWKERQLPHHDEFLEVLGYTEADFKTKRKSGRYRIHRAGLILDRLERCL